jgi:serine/threonine protein kinase
MNSLLNPALPVTCDRDMTARLSHWNTVEIFDYGRTDDDALYYVMEYLPGLSLEDLLQRHGPLPAERVIHLLRQTCQGLREAHAIGLIHRDIKPGNLFAAHWGGLFDVVKLLDFGLVKPVAEIPSARLTHEGAISGTPLFMSPEQARSLVDVDAVSHSWTLRGSVVFSVCGSMLTTTRSARAERASPSLIRRTNCASLKMRAWISSTANPFLHLDLVKSGTSGAPMFG